MKCEHNVDKIVESKQVVSVSSRVRFMSIFKM